MEDGMRSRFATLGILITGVAIGLATTGVLTALQAPAPAAPAAQGQPQGRGGRGPAGPPAPCGPQAQLPAELSKNVDPKSRCFEIRMYSADPSRVGQAGPGGATFAGGINELHQRFREKEIAIFQKHGATIVGAWQNLNDPNTLVWMLAYRDRAHREDVWAKFAADPEWKELQSKYMVPLMANTFMMSATDYSPMK
jgi:hypothetical protein